MGKLEYQKQLWLKKNKTLNSSVHVSEFWQAGLLCAPVKLQLPKVDLRGVIDCGDDRFSHDYSNKSFHYAYLGVRSV